MTAPASYVDSLSYIVNGEQVEASVANRTILQLKSNTDYLKNNLDNLGSKTSVIGSSFPVKSDVVVGTPVYYNTGNARYESAQAITGLSNCVGVVLSKASATVADILLVGVASISISSVLQTGDVFSAGRYYLSETQAGKLTQTVPYHSVGTAAIQVSVLVADGTGNVIVLPYEMKQGSVGPQGPNGGPAGPTGATGPQGPAGPAGSDPAGYNWTSYIFSGLSTPYNRWYRAAGHIANNIVTYTPTAGQMLAVPFISSRSGTLDRLGINVTGAATAGVTVRLGIYTATSQQNPYPSAKLIDAGTVAVDTTGHKTITISQALSAGQLYWLTILFDSSAPSAMAGNDGSGAIGVLGLADAAFTVGQSEAYAISYTQAYGALPSTFPSVSPTFLLKGTNSPLLACRYSA